jgi:RNA polymerase sigma-70 factor (ECF subfamily)
MIETAADRGSDSFREFVETHKRRLYWLALDLTGNHHDAEDLSQEVFIKAYRHLDGFRGEAKVSTWLRRIAVNTYLNTTRKKAVALMSLLGDREDHRESVSSTRSPDGEAGDRQIRDFVVKAMDTLSPRERSAFVLRHMNDLPVKEVAASMDIAPGTVKSLLHRATQKMQKELAFLRPD